MGRLFGVVLTVGMGVSLSGARGETGEVFHIACAVAKTADQTRATAICDEFIATAKAQVGMSELIDLPAPLTVGPGLEILVDRVGDSQLLVTPTWVDAEGRRKTQPSVGIRMMDRDLTENRRRDFYLNLLANTPR